MPSDTPVIRGALKLKGSAGIAKKKKKKAWPSDAETKSAIQRALEDEDAIASKETSRRKEEGEGGEGGGEGGADGEDLRELEERGNDGKTASERAYEEMRRKRVRVLPRFSFVWEILGERGIGGGRIFGIGADEIQLHERLQKEGVKTHKEKVEELNKYLSNLSEHHDMYVPFPFLELPGLLWYEILMLVLFAGRELDPDKTTYLQGRKLEGLVGYGCRPVGIWGLHTIWSCAMELLI